MRRRLLVTALVLDGLFAVGGLIAAPSVFAASGESAPDPDRYVEVDGQCIERDLEATVATGGWAVDAALCAQG